MSIHGLISFHNFRDWIFRQIEPLWPLMKILTIIARVLLGLGFVVFGSNAFLHFIPMPPIPQTLAGDFTRVFIASGYGLVHWGPPGDWRLASPDWALCPAGPYHSRPDHRQHLDLSRADGAGRFSTCTGVYRPRALSGMAISRSVHSVAQAVRIFESHELANQIVVAAVVGRGRFLGNNQACAARFAAPQSVALRTTSPSQSVGRDSVEPDSPHQHCARNTGRQTCAPKRSCTR